MRAWTKSACLVLAWSILAIFMVAVGLRLPLHAAQASTRSSSEVSPGRPVVWPGSSGVSSSTGQVVLASMNVTAAPAAARPSVRYVVRAGDTLSAIAAEFGVQGGWPALYAVNRHAIGPDPDVIQAGAVIALPGRRAPVRYTVAAGDSLSGIAAEFGVRGGWPALYAANRHAVGPDPSVIHAGIMLTIPHPPVVAPPAASKPHPSAPRPAPRPSARPSPAQHSVPVQTGPSPVASGMPGWLRTTLLAVGLLIAAAFVTEPVLAARRRRHRAQTAAAVGGTGPAGPDPQPGTAQPGTAQPGTAQPGTAQPGTARPGTPEPAASGTGVPETGSQEVAAPAAASPGAGSGARPRRARAGRAHIVLADHDRLVVTRSQNDDMVYVLRPPGADPKAILRVASLVLPECRYGELAEQLGVPATWPME
jgi:LysM repeat protein